MRCERQNSPSGRFAGSGVACGNGAATRRTNATCAQKAGRTTEQRTLSAEEFYVEQINRRYSRPNRCC